jgi:acetyl esterase/lipase
MRFSKIMCLSIILFCSFSSYCEEHERVKNDFKIVTGKDNYKIISDIEYLGPDRQEKMDVYLPSYTSKAPLPAVIWIHGGGWTGGDKINKRALDVFNTLTSKGIAVFSINYLLVKYKKDENGKIIYPIERDAFPQNIYDCKTAIRFVRKNAKTYNVDPNKIVLAGASAGGHLALITGMTSGTELDNGGLYKDYSTDVSGIISFYGPTDLRKFGSHMFAGETLFKCDKYSPVNYISKKTPPIFITHGTQDEVVSYSDTIDFIDKIKAFEKQNDCKIDYTFIPVKNGKHSYFASPDEKNGFYDLRPHILAFLETAFKNKAEFRSSIDSNECLVRDGLPNLFARLSAGQNITVAYFGGSITAQLGYRNQSFQWFKDTWPNVKFTQIDAAIGGTGSSLGAFRVYNDVLSKNPDLIFIEFAVNDYRASQESIDDVVASVEGIVRQIIRHDEHTDICFIYTITDKMIDDLKSGKILKSIIAHEKVAKHYGLPSINVGLAVEELLKQDKLVMKGAEGRLDAVSGESLNVSADLPVNDKGQIVFSKDGVHPYLNSGHKIYAGEIIKALSMMQKSKRERAHELVPSLSDKNLEKAKLVSLSEVTLDGKWEKYDWKSSLLSLDIKRHMPEIKFTKHIGDSISFKFKGKVVGFYDIMGPSAGVIECDVDGQKCYMSRFDKYCTYYRIGSRTYNVDEGEHRVKFTLTDREIDKAEILKQRDSMIDDPTRYFQKNWYVGNVMLVGDILPQSTGVEKSSIDMIASANDRLRKVLDKGLNLGSY